MSHKTAQRCDRPGCGVMARQGYPLNRKFYCSQECLYEDQKERRKKR